VVDHGVLRIAGGVQYLQRRPAVQCLDGKLPAVTRRR
jgi:hypothetical protein